MKILFSEDSMTPEVVATQKSKEDNIPFRLTRGEIVALFNGLGRYVAEKVLFASLNTEKLTDLIIISTQD